MDEEFYVGRPEEQSKRTRKPAAQQPAPGGEEEFFIGRSEPTVGLKEDLARSAGSGIARGVVGLAGLPGDIESLGRAGARYFGYNAPEETYLPTSSQAISSAENFSPAIKSALNYNPDWDAGRYAKSAAEFIPATIPAIFTGGLPLYARVAGGVGAGLGAQGAKDFIGEKLEPGGLGATGATLGSAVAGGMAGSSLASRGVNLARSILMPSSEASSRIAKSIASDATIGGKSGAQLAMDEAAARGVSPMAASGEQTKRMVADAASRVDDASRGTFNTSIARQRDDAADVVDKSLETMFGRPVKAFDEADAISQRVSQLNDVNYKRVMSLPQAQAVPQKVTGPIAARLPKNTINNVLDDMRQNNINPATLGLVKTGNNTYAIPPGGASLRFWDEVKQELDSQIGSLYDPITKALKPGANKQAATLMSTKSDLVNALDKAVKDYKQIRFEASELYGARNAIEAGYRFFNDNNTKNLHNMKKMVANKLTPAQREDFAYGAAGAYRDALEKNPSAALAMFSGNKAGFLSDKMQYALGPQRADELIGTVIAQRLNSRIADVAGPAASGYGSLLSSGAVGGAGGAAGYLGQALLAGESVALQNAAFGLGTLAAAGAVTGIAARTAYNAKERRVAREILRLAADPASSAKIARMIRDVPEARSAISKMMSAAGRAAPATLSGAQEQASGGRVGRASGGRLNGASRADMIIAQVDKARKELQRETGSLLNHDDSTIVKALKVANERI